MKKNIGAEAPNPWELCSFLEIELFHDCVEASWTRLRKVVHVSLAIGNHSQKTSSRMSILLIFRKMRCEFVDFLCEKGDLNFWRASVGVVSSKLADCLVLFGFRQHEERISYRGSSRNLF
jgi:hypothetical protein